MHTSSDDGMTWSVEFSALGINSYVHKATEVSFDQYNDISELSSLNAVFCQPTKSHSSTCTCTSHKTTDAGVYGV